jgi:hypothetical protein
LNSRSWSHNPTPQPLGHGHVWCLRERSNLRSRLFRPALVHLSYTGELGGDGKNRTLIGWVQTSSPPVERRPQEKQNGCGGGNRIHLVAAYETAGCTSSSSPYQNWSTEQESNLRPSAYQTDAQPAVLSVDGAPRQNRTVFSALQEGRIARNACGAEKSGAGGANRTLIGRLPCDHSATELRRLEPKGGFKLPSGRYEGPVLPTELLRPWSE